MRRLFSIFVFALAAALPAGFGAAKPRSPEAAAAALMPVLGEERKDLVQEGDTLLDIAYRNFVGTEALVRLNPGIDRWIPPVGSIVHLPTRYVLPAADPQGLVVNIPELRLYDFGVRSPPEVMAIAVGDAVDPTPIGEFKVGQKRTDPAWNVPESILRERPELPTMVPPGPDNPLGSRWMTIGATSYGLHGTNVRWSIGHQATHGCVRLYEEEIQKLYARAKPGTRIQIVYQPFKWGRAGDVLYLEAHPDIYNREPDRLAAALQMPRSLGLLGAIDLELVWQVVEEMRGVPIAVGRIPLTS